MKKLIYSLIGILSFAGIAYAQTAGIPITVPSAPGAGYCLQSIASGRYNYYTPCISGGGGAGTFSTSTLPFGSNLIQYPYTKLVTTLDNSATSTSAFWFDPFTNQSVLGGSATAGYITATSTTATSTFKNAIYIATTTNPDGLADEPAYVTIYAPSAANKIGINILGDYRNGVSGERYQIALGGTNPAIRTNEAVIINGSPNMSYPVGPTDNFYNVAAPGGMLSIWDDVENGLDMQVGVLGTAGDKGSLIRLWGQTYTPTGGSLMENPLMFRYSNLGQLQLYNEYGSINNWEPQLALCDTASSTDEGATAYPCFAESVRHGVFGLGGYATSTTAFTSYFRISSTTAYINPFNNPYTTNILGTTNLSGSTTMGNATIGSYDEMYGKIGTSYDFFWDTQHGDYLQLTSDRPASPSLLAIKSAGGVGIGTVAPATALDVNGDITDENLKGATCTGTDANGKFITGTCSGGSSFAYPFTQQSYGESTSTTINFTNGIMTTASSTLATTRLQGDLNINTVDSSTPLNVSALADNNNSLALGVLGANATAYNFYMNATGRGYDTKNMWIAGTSGFSDIVFDPSTNSGDSLFMKYDGNVGIHTVSPTTVLTVAGGSGITANIYTATSTTVASSLPLASTTALSATSLCLSTDCRTVWPTGGGGGANTDEWSTSTDGTSIYTNAATKIGIGTSTPAFAIDTTGAINMEEQTPATTTTTTIDYSACGDNRYGILTSNVTFTFSNIYYGLPGCSFRVYENPTPGGLMGSTTIAVPSPFKLRILPNWSAVGGSLLAPATMINGEDDLYQCSATAGTSSPIGTGSPYVQCSITSMQ